MNSGNLQGLEIPYSLVFLIYIIIISNLILCYADNRALHVAPSLTNNRNSVTCSKNLDLTSLK